VKHPIPEAALDSDIAILGRKGGGKTYTAKGIVERLLDMGRRVLVLDPLGVWAGLRTAADGQQPGYPVAIFGGAHADLPLDPAAAEPLARLIGEENLPAVVDLADLSKGKQQAFLLRFLRELRRVNREALTLVLEEADVFAPQNPQGDDSKELHGEIDWIARRGRFRGFRLITVTQRPARLSKDVLTQCATLIAHRLPAPQDRDAIKAWVDGNGDRDKAKEVFDTLAGLDVGEAWVWSPENDVLARERFPRIGTLDTSSTPKAGEKRIEPKTLAQVDVAAIGAALAEHGGAEPEEKPAKGGKPRPANPDKIAAAEQVGYTRGFIEGEAHGRAQGFADALARARSALDAIGPSQATGPAPARPAPAPARREPVPAKVRPERPRVEASDLHPAAVKLIAALARYPDGLASWQEACLAAGLLHGNGYFYGGRKSLVDGGLAKDEAGLVFLTPAGRARAGESGHPLTLAEILAVWSPKLRAPGAVMLEHLAKVRSCTPDELARATGLKPGNGYWYGGIAAIRDVGLVTADKTRIALAPMLERAP
jgi:hypothetical protein